MKIMTVAGKNNGKIMTQEEIKPMAKTPQEWIDLLSGDTKVGEIKHILAREVRQYLGTLAPGITITTNQLGEVIFPRHVGEATLSADVAMTQIYKMLQMLAREELSDCCAKGEVNGQYMGKPKRPWLWFCPEESYTVGQTVNITADDTQMLEIMFGQHAPEASKLLATEGGYFRCTVTHISDRI